MTTHRTTHTKQSSHQTNLEPPAAITTAAEPAPVAPVQTNNADKDRQNEQQNKQAAYGSKTTTPSGLPLDNQEKVTLGQLTTQIQDDINAIAGGRRWDGVGIGLQQPKTPGNK
jgi:hypothetical protein